MKKGAFKDFVEKNKAKVGLFLLGLGVGAGGATLANNNDQSADIANQVVTQIVAIAEANQMTSQQALEELRDAYVEQEPQAQTQVPVITPSVVERAEAEARRMAEEAAAQQMQGGEPSSPTQQNQANQGGSFVEQMLGVSDVTGTATWVSGASMQSRFDAVLEMVQDEQVALEVVARVNRMSVDELLAQMDAERQQNIQIAPEQERGN